MGVLARALVRRTTIKRPSGNRNPSAAPPSSPHPGGGFTGRSLGGFTGLPGLPPLGEGTPVPHGGHVLGHTSMSFAGFP